MAGLTWFELDVDMPDDPKCKALGVRLGTPLAFGYVVRLYAYCYRHGVDRFSGPGAPATVEDSAGWRGKTGRLLAALVAEGFIDHADGETLVVHGVAARLGPHLAKRERDAERMRERRADVARTFERRPRDVCGDKDKDKDKDQKQAAGADLGGFSSLPPSSNPPAPRYPHARPAVLAYVRRLTELLGRPVAEPRTPGGADLARFDAACAALTPEIAGTIMADEIHDRIGSGGGGLKGRPPVSLAYLLAWIEEQAAAADRGPTSPPRSERQLSAGCFVED